MPIKNHQLFSILFLTGLSTACLAGGDGYSGATNKQETPETSAKTTVLNPAQQADFALQDLAKHIEIPTEQIKMVRSDAVTWPSGALGCPESGKFYTQAMVPGVLIVLEADGEQHRYHAALGGEPFLCPTSRAQPPEGNRADR